MKLSIERYFSHLQRLIARSPIVISSDVNYNHQGEDVGYVRGSLTFVDGSVLHFREYVDAESDVERLMYSYHYMTASQRLIFRYDDVDHHRRLNLPTHPHHKHDGREENVIASPAPTLADVLDEIEGLVKLF